MIDELDKQLVHLLQEDARQSHNTLAKQLKVSPATVRRRIRKLTENRILRIVAILNPSELTGYFAGVIALDVAYDKLDSVVETLANRPEVTWVAIISGRFDIMAIVRFYSHEQLSNFIQTAVASLPGVLNTETFICLQVKKFYSVRM